jgi:DNA-binding LytR/AlgR family response regulator
MTNVATLTVDDFVVIGQGLNGRTIRVGDISTIEVHDNYLTVRSNDGELYETRGSLAHCKERLPSTFFTAGRHCIVNLAAVAKVNMAIQSIVFTMKDGAEVIASRKQSRILRRDFTL